MNPLDLVPTPYKAWVIGGGLAVLIVVAALAGAWVNGNRWEVKVASLQGEFDDHLVEDARATATAAEEYRAEERRRQRAVDEVEKQTDEKLQTVQADADTAAAESQRLFNEVQRLRAGRAATCDTVAAQQRKAGTDAFSVLADVFEESVRRGDWLAGALERSRIRGQACEAAYDELPPGDHQ